MKSTQKMIAILEIGVIALAFAVVFVVFFGCQPVKGFQYANGNLSSLEARNAAAVARAEAEALENIAAENDRTATRLVNTASNLANDLGAGGVGAVIGALSTLWVPPPRRKKKTNTEPQE